MSKYKYLPKVVTFTGADDSVKAEEILEIAETYPDTEWGILFGAGDKGGSRWPSRKWFDTQIPQLKGLNLCAHFCGRWVYDLVLRGDLTWLYQYDNIHQYFKRVQLNFHGQQFPAAGKSFLNRLDDINYQFIFQDDTVNGHLHSDLGGDKRVRLFDVSHGAGVLPGKKGAKTNPWPKRTQTEYMGYAGGLGPNNISEQLPLIIKAADPEKYGPYWIDMETKVRSYNDSIFDMKKIRSVCEQVWGD